MKDIKNKLLLSTSIVLCIQFSASVAMAEIQPTLSSKTQFYQAIDDGNFTALKSITDSTRASLLADKSTANYKVDLEFRDENGNTPLIRAAALGNIKIVTYFTQLGADVNAYNTKFETPLIAAYNTGHFDVAKYLLTKGAIDNYQIAQKIQKIDLENAALAEKAAESAASKSLALKVGLGAAIVGGGAAAIAGGSSGGGSSSGGGTTPTPTPDGGATISCKPGTTIHPDACDHTVFNTAEAQAQEGVLAMKADYAYAHGYDGRIFNRYASASGGHARGDLIDASPDGHVIVAVVDSGVDLTHTELDSNILTDLSVTCDDAGACVKGGSPVTGSYHGTWVAGVVAAERNETGTGMQGVAPEAHIIAVQAGTDSGIYLARAWAGINYAVDNGAQVINNSYGSTTSITSETAANMVTSLGNNGGAISGYTAFQNAVSKHAIIVFAAGNNGGAQPSSDAGIPYYFKGANPYNSITEATLYADYNTVNPTALDWSNNWVSVVSLDRTNNISSFSQRCGITKDWCLAAPGEITKSTKAGGGYSDPIQGTSFAAPNISGAIAIMLGAFPQKNPEEALQILFDTATDLGVAGVDDVYGHGLVNLQKATDPTDGGWVLSVSGSLAPASFYSSGFGLSAPFGNALAANNASLIFLDAYGKDYTIPLSTVSGNLTTHKTAFDKFTKFSSNDFTNDVNINDGMKLSFSSGSDEQGIDKTSNNPFYKFSFQSELPVGQDNISLGFNYKTNLANSVAKYNNPNMPENVMASDAYKNPYLNLTGDSIDSSTFEYEKGNSSLRMTSYTGKINDEYNYRFDNKKKVNGVFDEYTYSSKDKKASVSLNAGVLVEQNSLLGSETSGAFAIDSSNTYHTGISARYALTNDISLIGNYNFGVTKVSTSSDSIFTNFNALTSNSLAAGVEFANVSNEKDVLGFTASQPLRVSSGQAGLTLPVDVASNGSVIYQNKNINLTPTGREFDIESYYNVKFGYNSEFSLSGIMRFSPNNDALAGNDATVLGKYRLEF